MTPPKLPHENMGSQDASAKRALNTVENAKQAVETCRLNLKALSPGQVWNHRAPRGEFDVKGSLDINDQPVAIFHFNPEDTSLLPRGLHPLAFASEESTKKIAERLKSLASEITVLDGAEFREPEFCWAVPLAHQGRIVAHMKISADGQSVVPDLKAVKELTEKNY